MARTFRDDTAFFFSTDETVLFSAVDETGNPLAIGDFIQAYEYDCIFGTVAYIVSTPEDGVVIGFYDRYSYDSIFAASATETRRVASLPANPGINRETFLSLPCLSNLWKKYDAFQEEMTKTPMPW